MFALLLADLLAPARVLSGFVPDEDQGYIMILVQAPPGASLDYTMNTVKQAEQIVSRLPEHSRCSRPAGPASLARRRTRNPAPSSQDFKDRPGEAHSATALVGQLFGAFSQITGAMVIPFLPPSIQGWAVRRFHLRAARSEWRADRGAEAAAQQLIAQGNQTPGLTAPPTQFTASDPQLVVNIDRQQAKSPVAGETNTMQILLGSA